jgi:hypothetical protein
MTVVESVNEKSGVVKLPGLTLAGELPNSVVSRRQNASNEASGAVLDFATFYLEEFGWKTGEDATKALQEIIDYCVLHEVSHATIRLPPLLELNSAPRTDRQGNAIVALSEYGKPGTTLRLVGIAGGSEIITGQEGLAYSAEHGCPSMIGGPTPEQLGVGEGKGSHFSSTELHVQDVIIRAPSNSTICGIDASRIRGIDWNRLSCYNKGEATVEPTHKWVFGLRLPEGDNGGRIKIGEVNVEKWYAGIVGNSAHMSWQTMRAAACVLGLGVMGNTQDGGNDGHSSSGLYFLTEHCKYHVGSWSPTEGAISIPEGHPAQLAIQVWDIEDLQPGSWNVTVFHLLDANSQIKMLANFARVLGNVGPEPGPLLVSGARQAGLYDLTAGPYLVAPHGEAETVGTMGFGIGSLAAVTTATGTTAFGYKALAAVTSASGNTAFGHETLTKATGQLNCAFGRLALGELETGESNVAVGRLALAKNKAGSNNVAIGNGAGESATGSSSIYIGLGAGKNATASNELYIANNETTSWIRGQESGKKLGFFGVAPVARAATFGAVAETAPAEGKFGYTKAQAEEILKAINSFRTMLKNLGFME